MQAGDLRLAHGAMESYVLTRLRVAKIEPYRPPQQRHFYHGPPEGFTTTSGDHRTNSNVASSLGSAPYLTRQDFPSNFTEQMLAESPYAKQYRGASDIESGKGLKESGLDRTHHLADSSVRVIIEWLNANRGWQQQGLNFVLQWMTALVGAKDAAGAILQRLIGDGRWLTAGELERIAHELSNNPYQVGFGDATINERQVGSFFDGSQTQSGRPTPLASAIAQYTQALQHVGVPQDLLRQILAEVVNTDTGRPVSSMEVNWPPFGGGGPPFGGPPFGGGGSHGSGYGGGSSGFGFGGVVFK